MRALPALLAAALARMLPEDAEGEIASTVRVAVKMGLPELRAWAAEAASTPDTDGGGLAIRASHPSKPADAIVEALGAAIAAQRLAERVQVPTESPGPLAAVPAVESHDRIAALLRLLTAWYGAGALDELLATLPDEVIAAWHAILLESPLEPCVPSDQAEADPGAMNRALDLLLSSHEPPSAPPGSADVIRQRVRAAALLAASEGTSPTRPEARAAIESRLGRGPADVARPTAARPAPSGTQRAPNGADVRVDHALPFLLLGPLHRVGWLDVLEATLTAAGLEGSWPAMAIALATKALPEPERGWRRTTAVTAAASAFAGDAAPRPDPEVAELARSAAGLGRALDAVCQRCLLDGRDAHSPLLLCGAGPVHLLVDPPGAFVVAHAGDLEAACARARECHAPLFVPAEEADAALLAALDQAGATFVTSAPPTRGERWQPVPATRSPRLYTNRGVQGFRAPADDVALRARDSWRDLERRPLPGRPNDPALDRSLSLAAALALATIAWELWRNREPTDAGLALARFGDIPATVRFEEDRVRVRLPLGKRFHDLKDAGLLDDVPRVPWLGFRPVVFSGG
jgi:hypothetical protein